jgi:two-component system, cell cycle sensor histidine kinase and response regulator CckA
MEDQFKTKQELLRELVWLRQRIVELEKVESEYRLEQQSRENSELYRQLADNFPNGSVTIFNKDLRIIFVAGQELTQSGIEIDFFIGKHFTDVAPPETFRIAEPHLQAAFDGKIGTYETPYHGGQFYYVVVTPITDTDRKINKIMVVSLNITELKRAEEDLRESEARFRDLSQLLPEIVFETDQQGVLTFTNHNAFKKMGYTQEDFDCGLKALDMITPDDRDRAMENMQAILKGGDTSPNEYLLRRKDGYVFPALIFSSAITREGKSVGLRGVIVDITWRKRVEEEKRRLEEHLQRAEKMEALGTLAGGVAHDLNNVLGIIVGFSQMLLFDVDESNPLRPGLLNILNGSQRAAAIIQDLLTLARRGVASRQVLNLNKIIVDCQNSPELKNLSSYHPSVTIKTELEPDLLNLSGSAVHLGKTLFNLVSNASEAMPKGGILTIKTSNQYLDRSIQGYDEVREGDYVVLSVSDTGEGISEADLKRIFEPFYTKKIMGRSGTGLGLAVVWGTVKDHQGYINVQSEEGKGSTFTLYFPITREEITAEDATILLSEYLGKGETILVVDDVKGQRDLAITMLRKLNYNVTSVESGEAALLYLKENKVDLLVLDMIMDPGMDGLDTYKSILEIHPHQKAIIVSGFSESDRVHSAQTLGAGVYVRKPYVIEKLGLAVRQELDRT